MIGNGEILAMLRARPKQHALPGAFYSDPDIFARDIEAIFNQSWIAAGAVCELPEPGSFMTFTIGRSPVIVLRDNAGEIRAFFNSCRHRGSRVCDTRSGEAAALVCPYHSWTYSLEGKLLHAAHMPDDFDRSTHGLRPIAVAEVGGSLFVSLADNPPDIAEYARAVGPLLDPHGLARGKLAYEADMIVEGNWKLVMENSRECYHCRTQHPELMRTFLDVYDFRDPVQLPEIAAYWRQCEAIGLDPRPAEGPEFRATRLPFSDGNVSITMDGKPACARPLGEAGGSNPGSLRWVLYPSVFNHALADYAVMVRMLPLAPERSVITTKFYVDRDAVEGADYTLDRLTEVWMLTNEQDKNLIERNQAGVNSIGYVPGPYAPMVEAGVAKFVEWYAARMEAFLSGPALRIAAE
jgi:Rieske 2Fe-2S family protein